MSVGRVTVERRGHRAVRVLLDGVDVPHVRGVSARQASDAAPIVTLELVALAEFVDLDEPRSVGLDDLPLPDPSDA